ncbi:MAG: NAD(+)/NADH kinase [Ndongobacter sp.]|nr:NAD(+)/NADH kinase [Ndongobacter sp.]
MGKIVNLFANHTSRSGAVKNRVIDVLHKNGFEVSRIYHSDAVYNIVLGGDGTFLRAVRNSSFSSIPFVGINTGHLGFFQEIDAERLDEYFELLARGSFHLDQLHLLRARVETDSWTYEVLAVNEFAITSSETRMLHFQVQFDQIPLIDLAGDGILLSTPAGSTGYNLSAGGSILYQTLDGFQFAVVASGKSRRYHTLPASIVVPSSSVCTVHPDREDCDAIKLVVDGLEQHYRGLRSIRIDQPEQTIRRVVFRPDWYWFNLKDKFLQ